MEGQDEREKEHACVQCTQEQGCISLFPHSLREGLMLKQREGAISEGADRSFSLLCSHGAERWVGGALRHSSQGPPLHHSGWMMNALRTLAFHGLFSY